MTLKISRIKYKEVWFDGVGKQWQGEVTIEGVRYTIIKDTKQEIQKSVKNLVKHKERNYAI